MYIPPGLPQNLKKIFKIKKYTIEDEEIEKQQDREINQRIKDLGLQDHHPYLDRTIYKNNFPRFGNPIWNQSSLTPVTSTVRAFTKKTKKGYN